MPAVAGIAPGAAGGASTGGRSRGAVVCGGTVTECLQARAGRQRTRTPSTAPAGKPGMVMIGFDGSFTPTAAKGGRFYYGTSEAPSRLRKVSTRGRLRHLRSKSPAFAAVGVKVPSEPDVPGSRPARTAGILVLCLPALACKLGTVPPPRSAPRERPPSDAPPAAPRRCRNRRHSCLHDCRTQPSRPSARSRNRRASRAQGGSVTGCGSNSRMAMSVRYAQRKKHPADQVVDHHGTLVAGLALH